MVTKTSLSLVFFFCFSISRAQPYRAFDPDKTQYYTSSSGDYQAIKIVKKFKTGNDSGFKCTPTYRSFEDINCLNCFYKGSRETLNGATWIGDTVFIKKDGSAIFRNRGHRSILIETLANPGDSWKMFDLPGGSYIKATVKGISDSLIDGIVDTIKTIVLQACDPIGNNISNPWNNRELKLSKQHGLINFYDWFWFPDSVKAYSYSTDGMITEKELYNWQVGDSVETKYHKYWYVGGGSYRSSATDLKTLFIVLDRKLSPSADSIILKGHRIFIKKIAIYQTSWDTKNSLSIQYAEDTIVNTFEYSDRPLVYYREVPNYVFKGLKMPVFALHQTVESFLHPVQYHLFRPPNYQRKKTYTVSLNDRMVDTSGCILEGWPDDERESEADTDIAGIGSFYWHSYGDLGSSFQDGFTLTYFAGKDFHYGKFEKIEDESLGKDGAPEPILSGTGLYPNPTKDISYLVLDTFRDELSFQLFDICGKMRQSMDYLSGKYITIDLTGLSKGIYFYQLKDLWNRTLVAKGKLIKD